ncbi:MAG: YfhO family protein [Lachnospiraceae bacterium]|nr:YfhO family protein [Lachnospiraceae bacterium]
MNTRSFEAKNFIRKSLPLVVAFLAPIIILIIIYATREIYPFGDQMYLRSDMYHQYAPFLKLFQNTIKHGGSLDYTWNIGLGSNFLSTYAYYLASPLNWIVGILPSNHIPEIMSGFIMLKSGLMSAFMTYYLIRKFNRGGETSAKMVVRINEQTGDNISCDLLSDTSNNQISAVSKKRKVGLPNDYIAACFGIFYAMSGYMAAYSWNVMWLDCLCILPLMMLGLERLVKERKCLLYTICFALAVLSNYYIAIMLCIWSVCYFIYLLIAERTEKTQEDVIQDELQTEKNAQKRVKQKTKEVWNVIGRYLLYTFIGGCIGAVIFLPALMTLFGTASADSSFPQTFKAYYNLLELFAHGTMNAKVTMLEGYVPNIYSGIAAFALIPLYWLNKSIPAKERAGKSILMAFLIFSFTFNVPAFIWHGFHFPNSLPSRQSFIYIFLVLAMGYEAIVRIRKVTVREILICFGVAIAAVFALQVLYDSEDYPMTVAYVSAAFLIVYGVIMLLLNRKKYLVRCAAVAVLVILCVAEMVINTDETGYGTTERTSYVEDNDAIATVLGEIEDEDFYRVEKLKRRTKNDGSWSGYRSASVFSSVTTAALSDFYSSFGMQNGTNSFSFYGNTPLTSAMLGVRYVMTDDQKKDPLLTYVTKASLGRPVTPAMEEAGIVGGQNTQNASDEPTFATLNDAAADQVNGAINGAANDQANDAINGAANGQADGNIDGAPYDAAADQTNGQVNGASNEQADGSAIDQANGQAAGNIDGAPYDAVADQTNGGLPDNDAPNYEKPIYSTEDGLEADRGSIYLYKTRYSLPLGFMVRETTQAEVNLMTQNPFAVQNDFVDAAAGASPIFTLGNNMSGSEISYTAQEDGRLYFYVTQKLKSLTITTVKGKIPGSSNTFTSLECAMIVDAGEVKKGDELTLTTSDEEVDEFTVIAAMLDKDALDDAIQALGREPFEVEAFGDTYVKGSIDVSNAGMLFTTIPYDKGWNAYVDGKKAEVKDFYGAFIQLPLEEGQHHVEFRYRVPGKTAGLIISIAAVVALVVLSILRHNKKRRSLVSGD